MYIHTNSCCQFQEKQCSSASHCFFSSVQLQLERTRMVIELYSSKLMTTFERWSSPKPIRVISAILEVIEPCHGKLKPSYVLLLVGVFPNPQETFLYLSLSLSLKAAPNSLPLESTGDVSMADLTSLTEQISSLSFSACYLVFDTFKHCHA